MVKDRDVLKDVTRNPGSTVSVAWVVDNIRGFAESVLSVVPAGFESYARVFHPASVRVGPPSLGGTEPVRWDQVAAITGRVAHRRMQWESIGGEGLLQEAGAEFIEPDTGSMPVEVRSVLVTVLERHTQSPDQCWFAIWEGWGGIESVMQGVPTFDLPNRRYYLLEGPIHAAKESVDQGWNNSVSLWWPNDREWCVATEVDFNTTYVGGSSACIAALLSSDLEVYEVEPTDGITIESDTVNPPPPNVEVVWSAIDRPRGWRRIIRLKRRRGGDGVLRLVSGQNPEDHG